MDGVSGRLPEELEELPAGLALAAMLAGVDRWALSEQDRVRLARARHRLASHVQGELLADLYSVSREEPPADQPEPSPDTGRYPWAETEIAFALRWTAVAAGNRLELAARLMEDLPAVQAALCQGRIDMPKALVIAELTGWLPDREMARAVADRVLERSAECTTGQLRARLRRLVLAAAPTAAARRCTEAVRTRRVQVLDNHDGTGELWGRSLPPQDAAAAWERLTAIARAAKSNGDARSIDQLRADALLDLLVGEGVAVGDPITRHTGGLPAADGYADPYAPMAAAAVPAPAAGSGVSQPAPTADPAAVVVGSGAPAVDITGGSVEDGLVWPAVLPEPPDEISPHQVWPSPTGPPVDRWDAAGRAFDGEDLWPPDWPDGWRQDPAVAAAAGRPGAASAPPTPALPLGAPVPLLPTPAPSPPQSAPPPPQSAPVLPSPRRGVVELQVPLTTLVGLTELPGELQGFGPVVADIARQVATAHTAGTWRYSVYNELGELVCHGDTRARPTSARRTRRRPSARVAAFVRARDRTCVAPGCRRPARGCDLDHTVDWAQGGESDISNLGLLCRRHHRFKHVGGAEVIQPVPGAFGWTTPRGMQYVTTPEPPLLDHALLTDPVR